MNMDDLKELDLNNIGSWPLVAQLVVILLACSLIVGGVLYFDTLDQIDSRDRMMQDERKQKDQVAGLVRKAALLNQYKAQLQQMRKTYYKMRTRLPTQTQVAVLLEDISQKGRSAGLEFKLFDPQREKKVNDFKELPIQIQVVGTYHQLGNFVSEIAQLPRIVTLHNININRTGKSNKLTMTMFAKTYRYEKEIKKRRRGRRKHR
jgi:type IV pilus assembly protein PilO